WDIAGGPFQNFEQGLLHAFPAHVARNRNVVRFASDLVDLVNVNDPDLGAFDIVVGALQEPQNDVLDVFADVTGFGQRGGVGNAERHIDNPGERASQQRFAGTGRADEQDVAFFDLDIAQGIHLDRAAGRHALIVQNPLVMIVHRDTQSFLGFVLANDELVELPADFHRLGNAQG